MNDRIAERLQDLRREFETARRMLDGLDAQRSQLKSQLLRIAGAIQVLEELTVDEPATATVAAVG